MLIKLISILLFGLAGACVYRFRGSSSKLKKYFPRPVPQIVFSLPYAVYAYYNYIGTHYHILEFFIVLTLTTLSVLTGNGGWIDQGNSTKPRSNEKEEFLILWLKPKMSPYWYDTLGNAMNGFLMTLACGVATGNPWIAFSGLLKAPAYMLGNRKTWLSELLTGLFLWGSLAVILFST